MKKFTLITQSTFAAGIFLMASSASHGQLLAYRQSPAAVHKSARQNLKSLKSILEEIEGRYKISFPYDRSTITDKKVPVGRTQSVSLKDKLGGLLQNLNIDYEKLSEKVYLIVPRKSEITEQMRPLTPNSQFIFPKDNTGPRSVEVKPLSKQEALLNVGGTVADKTTDEPLPGVSILVKGTTQGTSTNVAGNYTLSLPDGKATLIFSYVGYVPVEVAIGGRSVVHVTLEADVKALKEVVVTALGISREKSSLAGKDSPLIVIDGIPVGDNAQIVSDLNAHNIESVSVLKGPSATALYGSRAGNGVLLITTKKGTGSKKGIGVSFNAGYTAAVPYKYIPTQTRFTTGKNGLLDESASQYWFGPEEGTPAAQWNSNGVATPLKFHPNNYKEYFQTGSNYVTDVSVQGVSDRGSYRLSISDTRGTGNRPGMALFKNAFNLAANYKVSKNFEVSTDVHLVKSHSDNSPIQIGSDYPYESLFLLPQHVDINALKDYWAVKKNSSIASVLFMTIPGL
ncbi:carboxypeptidase-like regulatory domain-containing protein [Dyadobacter sp. LHD-138]|uniref:carboxypeptidase-like regulatory domain-containing protein n=1 Tax=Dyadobacter sp. LHD-138 TaxID=3071413 RepID=UPI0027DF7E0D|nr:carboxypeptidase-like regulatory domain-containing protein [Dyadobacter sp. LHD-138]MDQ6480077.1 carboxypeptidase-like regulatory domain-containing protein [Dyadobacter sp. LHD-138]